MRSVLSFHQSDIQPAGEPPHVDQGRMILILRALHVNPDRTKVILKPDKTTAAVVA